MITYENDHDGFMRSQNLLWLWGEMELFIVPTDLQILSKWLVLRKIVGIITENDSLLGFPNAMMLYGLMSSALIRFGTRKNKCRSCNQV